jgi:hypothetical protein
MKTSKGIAIRYTFASLFAIASTIVVTCSGRSALPAGQLELCSCGMRRVERFRSAFDHDTKLTRMDEIEKT